jgi:glycerol-3-phosphate dehydrogenase
MFYICIMNYDLIIIGGGVNGAGIARDAAGRGLKTLLVEAEDLAGATSSASTKLIHGGLRYLEYYEFKLVHEALAERKRLLSIAPHIISPLLFVLPHDKHLRPAWLIRLGLFLYDHLASHGKLPGSHGISFRNNLLGDVLKDSYVQGFTYSDCWVDDARLVALNALDAKERGAEIRTRMRCTGIEARDGAWRVTMKDKGRYETTATGSMLVNAAGPWVRQLLDDNKLTHEKTPGARLVKGSHIVTLKLFEGDHAYILQQPDKRIIFAIPYEKKFTLIGTTDEDFHGDPRAVEISPHETQYLCDAINRSFKAQIKPTDVVWSYSGVRPLLDDNRGNASAVTRDYHLELEDFDGLPVLSVFGGKITTFRHLAEEAVTKLLHRARRHEKPWTAKVPLPGGDLPDADFPAFLKLQRRRFPWLPEHVLERFARAYGTRMDELIGTAEHIGDLGRHFGGCIYEAEVRYLIAQEFAMTAEDILWRRTKIGLHCNPEAALALEQAMPEMLATPHS